MKLLPEVHLDLQVHLDLLAYLDSGHACIRTLPCTALKKLSSLRVGLQTQQSYANVITEVITFYILTMDGGGDAWQSLKEGLAKSQQCISDKVPYLAEITNHKRTLKAPRAFFSPPCTRGCRF